MTMPGAVRLWPSSQDPTPGGDQAQYTISDGAASSAPEQGTSTGTEPIPGKGKWLEEPDGVKVAKQIVALWKQQDVPMSRRDAYWQLYSGWRRGNRGLMIEKLEDRNEWRVYALPGSTSRTMPDKTDELVMRTVANLLADDPLPDADPLKDTPEARDAAEFAVRCLAVETGTAGIDAPDLLRTALNKAGSFCSAFGVLSIDPSGKGFQLEERLAHPKATDASPAACQLNPETGLADADPILRYVAEDGTTLTDDPAQAKRVWQPGLKAKIITGRNLRFVPELCTGIEDAQGVLIAEYTTKGAMKELFPACQAFTPEQWKRLSDWTLPKSKRLLPKWARDYLARTKDDPALTNGTDELPDATPILTLSLTMRDGPEYSHGAYVVVSKDELLHRQLWYGTFTDQDNVQRGECLALPVFQVRWWDDAEDDDPYGRTVVEKLGPWDEVFATQLSSELDWAFRFNNPNVFLPITSPVQGKALAVRNGTPIPITSDADKPTYEVVPPWPASARELRNDARAAMNETSGLLAAGMGGETVDQNTLGNSGIQAQTILAQANVNLSPVRANAEKAYERLLMVASQLIKCFYSIPAKVDVVGADGAYKEEEWSGVTMSTAKNYKLKRGSMTGMSKPAKNAYIAQLVQLGLDPAEARRLITENLSGETGAQDNPYMLRVRRQIDEWEDGAPEGWEQAYTAYQQAQQQAQATAQQAQQTGQPAPALPQVPAQVPAPYDPFDPLPIDEESPVATIRHAELSRAMVRAKFSGITGPWRDVYLAAFERARKAAGIQTVAEQAQAQQAAQKAQTDATIATQTAKVRADTQGKIAEDRAASAIKMQERRQDLLAAMSPGAMAGGAPMMDAPMNSPSA